MHCLRRLVGAALLVAAVGACRLDVNVAIDVEPDGSGLVEVAVALDPQAAAKVPELADQLELDDLIDAGWTITGPAVEGDGDTWIRATKPFASPDDAGRVLTEVSGPDGPFRDFVVSRRHEFVRSSYDFRGTVDLTAGIEAFGDDALRQRLDGTSVGVDTEELERAAGAALDRLFRFRVAVRLPGDVDSNAPTQLDDGALWQPSLGERASLAARSESWNTVRIAWLALAAVAATAFTAVVAVRFVRKRHTG